MPFDADKAELQLKVISIAGVEPAQPMSVTFGETGGTIGRHPENDWVLPDPERYISGQHAVVSFVDGQFCITDTSSNGLFLNQAEYPLGKGRHSQLQEGDSLLIGGYTVLVSRIRPPHYGGGVKPDEFDDPFAGISREIDNVGAKPLMPEDQVDFEPNRLPGEIGIEPLEPGQPMPGMKEAVPPVQEIKSPAEPDHVPLMEESFRQQPPIPEDWYLETDDENDTAKPSGDTSPEIFPDLPSVSVEPAAPETPQPLAEAARPLRSLDDGPVTTPRYGPSGMEERALRAALARGLGIPEDQLGGAPFTDLLETLGRVTRTSLEGSMAILRARTEMKSEFRMARTMIKPVENNPLKFSVSIGEALPLMINPQPTGGYLPPVSAIHEANQDIEAHLLATMAGMQAALKMLLKRFEPGVLEKRIGRSALLDNLQMYRNAKTWDLFTELYSEIAKEAEDDFHQLFGETFASAYEEQIRRLKQLKQAGIDAVSSPPASDA